MTTQYQALLLMPPLQSHSISMAKCTHCDTMTERTMLIVHDNRAHREPCCGNNRCVAKNNFSKNL
jgi:hypothetical protein